MSRLAALAAMFLCGTSLAYELNTRLISDKVASQPIEVLYWVHPQVSEANLERARRACNTALGEWESVPTSKLRFIDAGVVHGAAGEQPKKAKPSQLLIVVGNRDELTGGGAAGPFGGNPGVWWGLVADSDAVDLYRVARHELGHALGFLHSTISRDYMAEWRPSMHWNVGNAGKLTADDKAAASEGYPAHGWCDGILIVRAVMNGPEPIGIPGVNVVVSDKFGIPLVARLTDERGFARLAFLPLEAETIRLTGAESFGGCCVGVQDCCWQVAPFGDPGLQVDNFNDKWLPLGDPLGFAEDRRIWRKEIEVGIQAVRIEPKPLEPIAPGVPFEWESLVIGGVRPLKLIVVEVTPGLTVELIDDGKGYNTGVRGRQILRMNGTVEEPPHAYIVIVDSLGTPWEFVLDTE